MNAVLKLGSATMILLLFLSAFSVNLAMASMNEQSTTASQTTCESVIVGAYDSIDRSNAVSNAKSSLDYTNTIAGYENITFNSIFQIARTIVPYPTCTVDVLSYNVVFALHNSTGGWAGYLVITESQDLAVIGSSLQNQTQSSTNYSMNWSGYEAYLNAPPTNAVYEAGSDYAQPTVSYDTTYGCGSADRCILSTWVGLEDQDGAANNHLDQDGTYAACDYASGSSCSKTTYWAWYQSGGNSNSVNCSTSGGSVTVSGGDTIYASVTNEAESGGSNTKYDFYIADSTSLTSCYAGGVTDSSMTKPLYGAFIDENAKVNHKVGGVYYYDPLAAFTGSSFTSAQIYTGGTGYTINNYYTEPIDMHNAPYVFPTGCGTYVDNVDYGSLNSAGDFSMTFSTNHYTPPYSSGC